MKRKLPIGVSDFKKVRDKQYYYIDKSLLIKEVIEAGSEVILLPRPRRFGKTLNLSMLRYFFEGTTDEEHDYLFENLKIWGERDLYHEHFGKYPVIYLTFKDIKELSWQHTYEKLQRMIATEYARHNQVFLTENVLDEHEKNYYTEIMNLTASQGSYEESLKYLSQFLERYHGHKVIILIDEYDLSIEEAFLKEYYDDLVRFMRNFFSGGLKDNPALEKGILTGITRVAKESIFSGLNNLDVYTLLSDKFDEYFGLLEEEVVEMLTYYDLEDRMEDVRAWYNGYQFGRVQVYNPWSLVKFISRNGVLDKYWVNTSSNQILSDILSRGIDVKEDFEVLLSGQTVSKPILEDIVYGEVKTKPDTIWSFLLFLGYLTPERQEKSRGKIYCDLKIPNQEIKYMFREIIERWFTDTIRGKEIDLLLTSLTTGDVETLEIILNKFICNFTSSFDPQGEPESVYHAFVLGLTVYLEDQYIINSNRESGLGRYDIALIPRKLAERAVIMEFKKVTNSKELDQMAEDALEQIKTKRYETDIVKQGIHGLIEYGMAFYKKEVRIVKRERSV